MHGDPFWKIPKSYQLLRAGKTFCGNTVRNSWKLYPISNICLKICTGWDFPGGPVVKTPSFHCTGEGLIPGQVTRTPHAEWLGQKQRKNLYRLITFLMIALRAVWRLSWHPLEIQHPLPGWTCREGALILWLVFLTWGVVISWVN